MDRLPLGQVLKGRGALDDLALASALAHQRSFGGRLGEVLVRTKVVTEQQLLDGLSEQLGVPAVTIGDRTIPASVLRMLPAAVIRSRRVLPLALLQQRTRTCLAVAFSDPQDVTTVDEVAFAAGMSVAPHLAGVADLARAIDRHVGLLVHAPAPPGPDHAPVALPDAPDEPMRLVDVRETRRFRSGTH